MDAQQLSSTQKADLSTMLLESIFKSERMIKMRKKVKYNTLNMSLYDPKGMLAYCMKAKLLKEKKDLYPL